MDSRTLRNAFGLFATGVAVVTARDEGGEPVGVTVNSFSTVSLEPPLVLWSIARSAHSYAAFAAAEHFAVHVLAADQQALSDRFARAGSDKFGGLPLRDGLHRLPLLDGVATVFECEVAHRYAGGDHLILVGRVLQLAQPDAAPPPLLFHHGRYAALA